MSMYIYMTVVEYFILCTIRPFCSGPIALSCAHTAISTSISGKGIQTMLKYVEF